MFRLLANIRCTQSVWIFPLVARFIKTELNQQQLFNQLSVYHICCLPFAINFFLCIHCSPEKRDTGAMYTIYDRIRMKIKSFLFATFYNVVIYCEISTYLHMISLFNTCNWADIQHYCWVYSRYYGNRSLVAINMWFWFAFACKGRIEFEICYVSSLHCSVYDLCNQTQ